MNTKSFLNLLLLAGTTTFVSAGPSLLDEFSRKGRVEIYGFGEYLTGWEETTFLNRTLSLQFDSTFGGGLGFGLPLGEHLNLSTDLFFSRVGVSGWSSRGTRAEGDANLLRWNVNLDYHILKRRLTPLLTGGAGIVHFNGDFGAGAEFSETDLTWGVGAGGRWDITDHWFIRAVYRVNWTSLQDSDHLTLFHSVALGVGYAF